MDYSRQLLPVAGANTGILDEANLNDAPGLGSGNSDLFSYTDAACHFCALPAPTDAAVNWAGTGLYTSPQCNVVQTAPESYTDTAVMADIDASSVCTGATDVLHGHVDWPDISGISFNYGFQCTPAGNTNTPLVIVQPTWVP
jgi:hypothetical protein